MVHWSAACSSGPDQAADLSATFSKMRWMRLRAIGTSSSERIAAARRRASMTADRVFASAYKELGGLPVAKERVAVPPAATDRPSIAIVTVNFSTTRYLKLLLLTLAAQESIGLVSQIVVVDNSSLDDDSGFLSELDSRCTNVTVVRRRHWLYHGPAMRAGLRAVERSCNGPTEPSVILFTDTDVVFRDRQTIGALSDVFSAGAAFAGEFRQSKHEGPDVQASFFAVRRDVYQRRDVAPLTHDGAPARRMQASIVRAGLPVADFPSNRGGHILHRGRTGVQAAAQHRPRHQYAQVRRASAHFMGISGGQQIWDEIESRYRSDIDGDPADLAARLAAKFQ